MCIRDRSWREPAQPGATQCNSVLRGPMLIVATLCSSEQHGAMWPLWDPMWVKPGTARHNQAQGGSGRS
eukprot:388019-Alexandrium_andersonii.AAC.1